MRDWEAFVRSHLPVDRLSASAHRRAARELAQQLEDFYLEAKAAGASDDDADTFAREQIRDWPQIVAGIRAAGSGWRPSRAAVLLDRLERGSPTLHPRKAIMFAHVIRDAAYAGRQLKRSPAFTVIALLTIALAIGASSAMFSVVNGIILKPLPYAAPERLVRVYETVPAFGRFSVAPANYLDWREQSHAFSQLAAYEPTTATLLDADGPTRVQGLSASADLLPTLGVSPLLGGWFARKDEMAARPAVIVISHRLWQERFGGDAAVVGRTITVNGGPVTVVGVMPADFYFPTRSVDFWVPLHLNPTGTPRGAHYLGVVGRLADGSSVAAAAADVQAIAGRLARQYPNENAGESAEVLEMKDQVIGGIRPTLLTLLAAVGIVVLIGCTNVAQLLLVRGVARQREMAMRQALGASRARLVAQLLTESLVLALAGGGLGVLLAYLVIRPIRRLGAETLPRVGDIAMDGHVLLFAAAASCVTALVFGLVPAWQSSRSGPGASLTQGSSRSATASAAARTSLLVAEVALSLVLAVGACLLLRSFARLSAVDVGFDPSGVLAFQVSLPSQSYPDATRQGQFYDSLEASLRSLGGVNAVGMVQTLPLRGNYLLSFEIRGRAPSRPGQQPSANYRVATASYFDALRIPIERGRGFTAHDTTGAQPVAIVDKAFVRKYFGDQDPIGQALAIGNTHDASYEIVGVVGDVHHDALESTPSPTMYLPLAQDVFSSLWVLVRTAGDPTALTSAVRTTMRSLDPRLPAYSIQPLQEIVHDSVAVRRFTTVLLVAFAAFAVFLAAIGLYGVISYAVSQRTREFAVRMSIGASPGDVTRLVMSQALTTVAGGLAIGGVLSWMLAPLIRPLLFDVHPSDLVSFSATTVLLLAVALVAAYVPARRAMRINPVVAMQKE
jgi:putative ABC transport system permease protein